MEGDLQVQGGQLLTKLGHELEEQVIHLIQVAYERVEGGLLEQEIQRPTRAWLVEEEGLSLRVEPEAEDWCEREEGEESNVMGYMVLVWVERWDERVKRRDEAGEKRRGQVVVVVDEPGMQEEQGKLSLQVVVVDVAGEEVWEYF